MHALPRRSPRRACPPPTLAGVRFRHAARVAPLALATLLAAPLAAEDTVPVTLAFAGEFGGEPFDCSARFEGIGAGEASVAVADYRLYVSRVRLLDADGGETPLALDEDGRWQSDGIALVDFEDGSGHCTNGTAPTNVTVSGRAPAGDYTGVAFDIGVPFESNHGDPTLAASPLNLTGMFWNWRGGYRFLRVDLASVENPGGAAMQGEATDHGAMSGTAADDTMKHGAMSEGAAGHGAMTGATRAGHGGGHGGGWALHVGSTGCTAPTPTTAPDACAAPNRIEVVLADFDPATGTVVVDPAAALAGVDVSSNTPDTAPGCMSSPDDPECGSVLGALGLDGSGASQAIVTTR